MRPRANSPDRRHFLRMTAALGGVALWKLAALGASAHELVDERVPAE